MTRLSLPSNGVVFERRLSPIMAATPREQRYLVVTLAMAIGALAAACAAARLWLIADYLLAVLAAFLIALDVFNRSRVVEETIRIEDGQIAVEQVCGRRTSRRSFPVAWTRLVVLDSRDWGCEGLSLQFRQERCAIAAMVSAPDRTQLAAELKSILPNVVVLEC